MWYVYVLESLRNGKLYIGYADDLKRRFTEHNQGKGEENIQGKMENIS